MAEFKDLREGSDKHSHDSEIKDDQKDVAAAKDKIRVFPVIHSGAGQYAQIDGEKYERNLLEYADEHKKHSLGIKEARYLWVLASDGHGVTETEAKTLKFILKKYNINADAEKFLNEKFQERSQKLKGA